MSKSLKKRSYRFVVVLLLFTTLLTFNVGRVTKVDAVATTAAIAGAALIGTGAIYLGYLALTGGEVSIPSGTGADIENYLKGIGEKVAYYGSGAFIYNKLYQYLRGQGVAALNNYDVTLTQDDLKDLYNDFKDISINQNIQSFTATYDIPLPSTNFDYPFTLSPYTETLSVFSTTTGTYRDRTFDYFLTRGYTIDFGEGYRIVGPYITTGTYSAFYVWGYSLMRNILKTSGTYGIQAYYSDAWHTLTQVDMCVRISNGNITYYAFPYDESAYRTYEGTITYNNHIDGMSFPMLLDAPIFVQSTGEIIEVIPRESTEVITSPNYPDNNDDEGRSYPIVPYVQLPDGGNWGFNLGDLIERLGELSGASLIAEYIGDLINSFKDLHSSDSTYIYYDNSVTGDTYYIYYTEGNEYNYHIDVSENEDVIPVDLNTISQYTNNHYLTVIKEHAQSFGQTFGELVAFWHNCDPEIIYAFLGASIIVLLGAFIGKWGHS